MGPHFRGHDEGEREINRGVERSGPGAIGLAIPMERRRSGAALQNVAAIPWLVLRACFLECGQCSAASGTQCKLALGVRNLATEAVALQWS